MTLAKLLTALARTAAALSEARWMSRAMQTWPHVAGGPHSAGAAMQQILPQELRSLLIDEESSTLYTLW